jgi:5-methyltetrahydrofolate--homocysteine methyltransferase
MERLGLTLPLLIGGATTSENHTAVKIAPHYSGPVIHVKDASRGVGVCRSLLDSRVKEDFVRTTRERYEKVREEFYASQSQKRYLPIAEARERGMKTEWQKREVIKPSFLGTRVFDDYDLKDIRTHIDWSPFFMTWELNGKFPQILNHPKMGEEAKRLYQDAQTLLDKIIAEKLLTARSVIGFFPAASVGDDIEIYKDDERQEILTVFHTLRQQMVKHDDKPYYALADFIAPKETGLKDYIGGFAVTAGIGTDVLCAKYEVDHDDYQSILVKAIADRLAEAFAERMHERVRREFWGYVPEENLTNEELIQCRYQGIRPAPGYPACPDHTEKALLFDLLKVTPAVGISLTESFAMMPASSVSGIYFSHPDSKYFWLGKIAQDQVEDLARRKAMPLADLERWLSPNLGYA